MPLNKLKNEFCAPQFEATDTHVGFIALSGHAMFLERYSLKVSGGVP